MAKLAKANSHARAYVLKVSKDASLRYYGPLPLDQKHWSSKQRQSIKCIVWSGAIKVIKGFAEILTEGEGWA